MLEAPESTALAQLAHKRLCVNAQQISDFCRRWQIAELSLFGSILRPDFADQSDIDVMVTFHPGAAWSLMDWVQMRDELQSMFSRRVDLVEKRAIRNPFRRHSILNSSQVIYAA
jgi:hypothetical protein